MVDFYAGLARSVYGRSISLGPKAHGVVLRDPVGVVAIVTPWNWPLLLTVRALAPALAAGNACVVKPASVTSASIVHALRLLAAHPDLPGGALTCLLGSGARVGDALVGSAQMDMVAFTGDTSTGVQVMQRAAEQLVRVSLELGGKSANLVFADADLDKAVDGALDAILTTTGQVCTAGSRLLVERSIHDAFVDRLRVAMEAVVVGDPLDAATGMGPLVSPAASANVRRYVGIAAAAGTLVTGGAPVAYAMAASPAASSHPLWSPTCRRPRSCSRRRSSARCSLCRPSTTRPRRSPSPTTPATGWPRDYGRPTSAGAGGSAARWMQARYGSTPTTTSTPKPRSAG